MIVKAAAGVAAAVAAALAASLLVVTAVASPTGPATAGAVPSAVAVADIPVLLLDAYRDAAGTCEGLSWTVLAGIGKIESDHARINATTVAANGDATPHILGPLLDGTTRGTAIIGLGPDASPWHDNTVFDRAVGPMQFLTATFAAAGVDGNGDGVASPHNAIDAIASAANYLCGPGGAIGDVDVAVRRYNNSSRYVADVSGWAARYAATPTYRGADAQTLLAHPNVTLTAPARADLQAGVIAPRLVAVLLAMADHYTYTVSVLRSGHATCVAGTGTYPACTISRHTYGAAADIATINAAAVSDANPAARAFVETLLAIEAGSALAPANIGHPYHDLIGDRSFNNAAHENHVHLAVTPNN